MKLYNKNINFIAMTNLELEEDRSSFKYHFMSKILQESQEKWMYRPLRCLNASPPQQTPKDILRQTIISERKTKPKVNSIKGELITGHKKPIQ